MLAIQNPWRKRRKLSSSMKTNWEQSEMPSYGQRRRDWLQVCFCLFVYVVFGWYVHPWICPAVRLPMVKIDTSFLLPLGDYIEKLFQSFHSNHPLLCSTISHTHAQLVFFFFFFFFKITIYWLWTWAINDWLELTCHIPFLNIFLYSLQEKDNVQFFLPEINSSK